MSGFLVRRLAIGILTILASVTVVFLAMRVLPGNPAAEMLGDLVTPAALQRLEQQMGLDKPLWSQYGDFLQRLVTLDFGESLQTRVPISYTLRSIAPFTVELVAGAVVLGVLIGLPVGIVAAVSKGRAVDQLTRIWATAGYGIPEFLLASLLLYVFAIRLGIAPLIGSQVVGTGLWGRIHYALLPIVAQTVVVAAIVSRLTRGSMLDELQKDYVRTARSKGISENMVLIKHALRNGLIPVVVMMAMQVPRLVAGAVYVEIVFTRPGIGRLLLGGVRTRDYPLVEAIILMITVGVVLSNIVADLALGLLDPRIRYD